MGPVTPDQAGLKMVTRATMKPPIAPTPSNGATAAGLPDLKKRLQVQVAVIWAVQNQYLDDVPVDRVKECQTKLTDFLTSRKAGLMARMAKEKMMSDPLVADLKAMVAEFKTTFK